MMAAGVAVGLVCRLVMVLLLVICGMIMHLRRSMMLALLTAMRGMC